ncbi:hypothetical protein IM697_18375 [Streptomyces ferrugineus]|uniref:Uncharacterized protein n=1 Tax=Streptomyces ferrugineus TaxID=1413221 RepID=A0A7M2SXF9_9ACTN|nr:hypothetical protein [Streptomyces ferrugineus]QOV40188.1 hypothetical protein IM697_18375 [Streptomyces ferrugineus]
MTAITTAAGAARKAVAWATSAEDADKAARDRRQKGNEWASRRGGAGNAADWHERAESWERTRDKAVAMANMWANVAGVMHLAEEGEPS